jgi:folate-binding protein YgfZ
MKILPQNRGRGGGYTRMTETTQRDQQQLELAAIQTGAAIIPITRGFLRITGPDATRWLNGMVTNNIAALAPGQGNYNFLLNAQGRIQGDCTIYREYREPESGDPRFFLETDASQLETIQQLLDKFIIMDDVELSTSLEIYGRIVPTNTLRGFAITGKEANEMLADVMVGFANEFLMMDVQPGSLIWGTQGGQATDFMLAPPNTPNTYEIWCSSSYLDTLHSEFIRAGAIELSHEAAEAHRILSGTPRYGQDIRNTETNKDLPQETAQTHALHFAKGCYLGQEIVERIHSRGQLHRTFTQFTLTGTLPKLPAPLEANGKSAGELTSAIQIGDQIHALGYLRREAQSQTLTYPGGTATPITQPLNHLTT